MGNLQLCPDEDQGKTLIIIPCGKMKIWDKNPQAGATMAKYAYISNYFSLCRQYAEIFADEWMIFSGKYGLIEPDFILEGNYDIKLKGSNEFKRKAKRQLEPVISKGFTKIISLCGKYYSQFLNKVTASFDPPLQIQTPLSGLRVGERQNYLKHCIEWKLLLQNK